MPFVADASATLPWCFSDESTSWSEALLQRLEERDFLYVPAHWLTEITNALRMAERRGRISPADGEVFLEQLSGFAVSVDSPTTTKQAKILLQLSRKHQLTIYDALYLELALRQRLPLATLDDELIAAALTEGVQLL